MKKLERSLSLSYVVAIGIGGMLGSGLFVLPGLVAAKTGAGVWLAFLLAGLCVLPAALSKAELATAMPTSGGTYVYIERTFGPIMGTISGIGLWLSILLKSAFALVGFGAYLIVMVELNQEITALLSLVAIMLLNIFGVKKVGKVQLAVVVISMIGLVILMIVGMPKFNTGFLTPLYSHGSSGFITATAFVTISYAGIIKVVAIAEEIKNPQRNLPLAMIITLFLITAIYVIVTLGMVGLVPMDKLAYSLNPVYLLAEAVGGHVVGIAVAVLGVIALLSGANSGVLASSRFPFAMSRDKLLPDQLSKVHAKYLTPVITIVLTCGLMAAVILFLDVEKIAKLASAFMDMMFIMVNACVIVLRETSVQWYEPSYKSPWYPFLHIFGIVSGLVLLVALGMLSLLAIVIIALVSMAIFWLYGRKQSQRSGVLKLYGHRPALFLMYERNATTNTSVTGNWLPDTIKLANLDGHLSDQADVVVPLLGEEKSPEMLVEIAAALSNASKLQVVHLTEVPDQVMLDHMLHDGVLVSSLNRRVAAMAEERKLDVDFDAAVTHELVHTIHEISNKTSCKWMVLSWDGRASQGILVRNPVGWLVSHINCNLALFLDKGVRYIRKILVCLRSDKKDSTVISVANEIAKFYGAQIHLIQVVPSNADEQTMERMKRRLESFHENCECSDSFELLQSNDPISTITEITPAYDLLITRNPQGSNFMQMLFGRGKDRLTEQAACSVLRITTPKVSAADEFVDQMELQVADDV